MRTQFTLPSGTIAALDNIDTGDSATAGSQPARPVVLLVPGYTGSKEDFLPLLRPLADAGYRAVAIDQRGQFESAWATSPAGYTFQALAEDVCQLAAELAPAGSRLHLVGHSLGGLVGRAAVLAKSELFDSFTLMSSGPAALTGQRRTLLDAGELVLARWGMAGLWSQIEASAQADPKYARSSPALRDFLRTRFMATDPVGLQVMGNALRTVEDGTDELSRTGLPMLVLHGESDDAWAPALQAEMARRLGAAHVVIAAAAHSPAVENPVATVRALLRFWQSLR
ncbi:alpha/beta fold hydrolase [Jatrophihabitans sp.]|uniref:alpha/beta fold hydrolase n=1 Tax=Jatrophihabitans sp. TaxID=1932789 RepID=UPI002EE23F15